MPVIDDAITRERAMREFVEIRGLTTEQLRERFIRKAAALDIIHIQLAAINLVLQSRHQPPMNLRGDKQESQAGGDA